MKWICKFMSGIFFCSGFACLITAFYCLIASQAQEVTMYRMCIIFSAVSFGLWKVFDL